MKKVLVVLLVLCVGAGAFAQEITPYGSLRLDFGGSLSNDGDNSAGSYIFSAENDGTGIGVRVEADNFEGDVSYSLGNGPGSGFAGHGKVTLADIVGIEIGKDHLPSANWGGLPFGNKSFYSIGATSLGQNSYFKVSAFGAHLGLAAPDNNYLAGFKAAADGAETDGRTPIFFLGYDFAPESGLFSLGFTFTGQSGKSKWTGENKFPLLATLKAKVNPTETISITGNAGLYMAPSAFDIAVPEIEFDKVPTGGGFATEDEAVLVAGHVSVAISITEAFGIGFGFGGKGDFASKDDNGGASKIMAGLGAVIGLNEHFILYPGLDFTMALKGAGGAETKGFDMNYGVTLKYSF